MWVALGLRRSTSDHFAPGGSMALVDNDDGKRVFAVMLGEEAGISCFVDTQRLVGGDVDARIGGCIAATFGFDNARIVAEGRLELRVGLLTQFVPVTEEQRRFRQP